MNFFKAYKTILFLGCFHIMYSQNNTTNENPQWIEMMNDPNVNYYQAIKNFDNYWKDKERPIEEEEVFINAKEKIRKHKYKETQKYAFEYKKFMYWK